MNIFLKVDYLKSYKFSFKCTFPTKVSKIRSLLYFQYILYLSVLRHFSLNFYSCFSCFYQALVLVSQLVSLIHTIIIDVAMLIEIHILLRFYNAFNGLLFSCCLWLFLDLALVLFNLKCWIRFLSDCVQLVLRSCFLADSCTCGQSMSGFDVFNDYQR